MQPIDYRRHILALDDTNLEVFVREWIGKKTHIYKEITRFSGSGDLGRDVVGFYTKNRHEGAWDNYQCKQYGRTVSLPDALLEIGKILYYSSIGKFSPPLFYYLVAPRGLKRNLQDLLNKPTELQKELLENWDQYCSKKIQAKNQIKLGQELKKIISEFDFSKIIHIDLDYLLEDPEITPILYKWFRKDPGPAPTGKPPIEIQKSELPYIKQLIDAYNERSEENFKNHNEVMQHPEHGKHLSIQRERYYEADAFKRFYRDNTDQETLDSFEKDIYHSVIDVCLGEHQDSLSRLQAVMIQAANTQLSGLLAQHARVPVKQGICHHFANEERLKWRR